MPPLGNGWGVDVHAPERSFLPGLPYGYASFMLDPCFHSASREVATRKVRRAGATFVESIRLHECSSVFDPAHYEPPRRIDVPVDGIERTPEFVRGYTLSDGTHFDWVLVGHYLFELRAKFDNDHGAGKKQRAWFLHWAQDARTRLEACGVTLVERSVP